MKGSKAGKAPMKGGSSSLKKSLRASKQIARRAMKAMKKKESKIDSDDGESDQPDTSTITKAQRHVFSKALAKPDDSPGAMPEGIRAKHDALSKKGVSPKDRNALAS